MKNDRKAIKISSSLQNLLKDTKGIDELDLSSFAKAVENLETDPQYNSDYIKAWFVEQIRSAMEEGNISNGELAQKWGRSKQYLSKLLSEDKRVNFTIETMVALAILVDRKLEVHVCRRNQSSCIFHSKVYANGTFLGDVQKYPHDPSSFRREWNKGKPNLISLPKLTSTRSVEFA